MDFDREAVFVNDPARGKLMRIERADFEKEWQAVGNWMLLADLYSAAGRRSDSVPLLWCCAFLLNSQELSTDSARNPQRRKLSTPGRGIDGAARPGPSSQPCRFGFLAGWHCEIAALGRRASSFCGWGMAKLRRKLGSGGKLAGSITAARFCGAKRELHAA